MGFVTALKFAELRVPLRAFEILLFGTAIKIDLLFVYK
jgi:hypothetical protein